MKQTKKMKAWVISLAFALLCCIPLHAQDFSELSEDNPLEELSVTSDYIAALNDGVWKSINTDACSQWKARYQDDAFSQSINTLSMKAFESYLVSPALNLSKLSGQTLSFEWSSASVKGTCTLQAVIIDKTGTELAKLTSATGEVGSKNTEWNNLTAAIPTLSGTGFLAFVVKGDKANRASYWVCNIKTVAGELKPSITITPNELEFSETNVGESSYVKTVNVLVSNFNKEAEVTLGGADAVDFQIEKEQFSNVGGKINVMFAPKSAGEKNATIVITAGEATAEVQLKAVAVGAPPTDVETVELLSDQFFYDFEGNKPKSWQTKGEVAKIEDAGRYNSSSGFAVGIKTTSGETGYIKQEIDLKRTGFELRTDDEVECVIHYSTISTTHAFGPLRLAFKWLDADGKELMSKEKDMIDNQNIFFGRKLAYATLKFRATCPVDAVKLIFAIEVAPESEVKFDDFECRRLSNKDRNIPLVAVLPQYITVRGEVGTPIDIPMAIQMKKASNVEPNFNGTDYSNVLKITNKLPADGTISTQLIMTPTKKGAYEGAAAYSMRFNGFEAENSGSTTITAYIMDKGKKPTITQVNPEPIILNAAPGKTAEKTLDFNIENAFYDVKLMLKQPVNGAFRTNTSLFWYNKSKDNFPAKSVKITFAPLEAGNYEGKLYLYTELADTLIIDLKGVSVDYNSESIIERFSTNGDITDNRFKTAEWNNFKKFDQGYWKLEGKWNKANNVSVDAQGTLYFDELFANGIHAVSLLPKSNAGKFKVQYSYDGGGHWADAHAINEEGKVIIDSHRTTWVRWINQSGNVVDVDSIIFEPNSKDDKLVFKSVTDAMLTNTEAAKPIIDVDFNGLRHTRVLGIEGWQNITVKGESPFTGWREINGSDETNRVAQISFWKTGIVDNREHESWLLSPTLSYKNAASKILTFRLRYEMPVEGGDERFNLHLIAEQGEKPIVYDLDLRDFIQVVGSNAAENFEGSTWYDFYIDLNDLKGLNIEDNFHVAFSYSSSVGGNQSILKFWIDDLTFGRTDLPVINVDKEFLQIVFQPGITTKPEVVNVTTERSTSPVTVTLVPSSMTTFFKMGSEMTQQGGAIAVGYKAEDSATRAAALLIQTRGAKAKLVKLLAISQANSIENVSNEDDIKVYPIEAENIVNIEGNYNSYDLYTPTGILMQKGAATSQINVTALPKGLYILRLNDKKQSIKVLRIRKK